MYMGAGKYDNKHGVEILLNKKWRQRSIDTEYISERAITTMIMVNHQRIKLISVYFPHYGYPDHHIDKMHRTNEKHTSSSKKSIQTVGGYFNAELGPGYGVERAIVGPHTFNEGNKRGDWLKHLLTIQNFTAPNTMYRKTLGKQTTYRSPEGTEKQIDCILIKRRHLKYSKDAEANDMIHMGSEHRCVMATCAINTPKKECLP